MEMLIILSAYRFQMTALLLWCYKKKRTKLILDKPIGPVRFIKKQTQKKFACLSVYVA